MKANFKLLVPALLALAMPCFVAGQDWTLPGNNNALATSWLGTTNAQPLRIGTQQAQPIQLFTGGSAAANQRMTILSGGNVGINVTNPTARLEVGGLLGIQTFIRHIGDDNSHFGFAANDNFRVRTNGTDRFFITSAGDVGVATLTPLARFHVTGSESNGSTASAVRITSGTGASAQNMFIDGNEIDAIVSGLNLQHNTVQNLLLVNGGGRVGIGNTNPAEKFHLTGNALVDGHLTLQAPNNHTFRIQTLNDGNIHFIGDGVNRMSITDVLGYVGIGNIVPQERLHVAGNMLLDGFLTFQAPNNHTFRIQTENDGDIHFIGDGANRMSITDALGYVGIGTAAPTAKLHVQSGELRLDNANGQTFDFNVDANGDFHIERNGNETALFIGDQTGRVGIGTTDLPSGYLLSVNGRIISEEVRVELSENWPDYVFRPGHQFLTLPEVKSYVETNHRLPGIPSAAEVEENGLHVGEMQTKMMVKLEELYLHVIQMNERVAALERENAALRQQVPGKK